MAWRPSLPKHMKKDVLNGDIYVFISKRRNGIKLLRFEGDGFAIFYKQLEQRTFELPAISDDAEHYYNRRRTCFAFDNSPSKPNITTTCDELASLSTTHLRS